jgi:hypothetical protein
MFRRHQEAVDIAHAARSHNLLKGEVTVGRLVNKRCRSPCVASGARWAEGTACRLEIFGEQDCVVVLGDIATARVRFVPIGQELAPRQEPVGAIVPGIARAMGLPGHPCTDGEFVN